MANTFKIDTKSSVSTSGNNVVTAGGSSTLVILSILIANKTAASAQADVFINKKSQDDGKTEKLSIYNFDDFQEYTSEMLQ